MSHPDPLYDPENSYEDDMNYDDYNDFHDEDEKWMYYGCDSWDEDYDDTIDDSMDGDAESAFDSIGWGCDEQYDYYGEDF